MSKIVFASIIIAIICLASCKKSEDSIYPTINQTTKNDSLVVNNQDLNIDKITLSVKGKLIDCNGKPLSSAGISYSIIYKNGMQTFRSIVDANKDGTFDFNIYFNKGNCFCNSYLDKIRIVAFDISGEKESTEQFIPLKAGINDLGSIKICNPMSEYIKVTTELGKTTVLPCPLLSICKDSLCFIGHVAANSFMLSSSRMSLPLKIGTYDGYMEGTINEEKLQDNPNSMIPNAKVTYSSIANKIGEYYEGSYQGNVFNGKQKVKCYGLFKYRKRR